MKYIKTFENFTPIKINNAKPFKIKKNINKSIQHLQRGLKSLKGRIWDERDIKKRSDMSKEINNRVKRLGELNLKNLKQLDYMKNNPVKESRNYDSDDENSISLVDVFSSPDFKPEDILNYIGLDKDKFEFKNEYDVWTYKYNPKYDKDGFEILMNTSTLEDLMNIENNFINYIQSFNSYGNNYEYYVEDDELDYTSGYLSGDTLKNIKELSILFDYEIDPEEDGSIRKLFKYLCLDGVLDDIKSEISMENERAVEKSARALVKSLPFELTPEYGGKGKNFNISLFFEYDTIIEYMKKHDIKVSSIKELLENLYEASDFSYDFEYEGKYDFLGDFADVNRVVDNAVDQYINNPDDLFVKIIEFNNLELFKKKIDLANFRYNYDLWLNGNRKQYNLFEIAKAYNNDILKWFKSYEFQYRLLEELYTDHNVEIYKSLDDAEIIDPKIKEEYLYLIDAGVYNL
jgi:hypothetical protein